MFLISRVLTRLAQTQVRLQRRWTPYYPVGHHITPLDTILPRWTPYYPVGHHITPLDTILPRWTPYYPVGHHMTTSETNFVLVKQKLFPFETILFTRKKSSKIKILNVNYVCFFLYITMCVRYEILNNCKITGCNLNDHRKVQTCIVMICIHRYC